VLRSFFPTRLDTWAQCPRRYRFRYLDDPSPPTRGAFAHQTLGAATHLALATWWRLPESARTPDVVAALVDEAWSDAGFADAAMSQRWLRRARDMVARYVAAETGRRAALAPFGLVEPRRVESSVALRIDDTLALMGRPDRVDERPTPHGTELVVVDYKTGRREPDEDEARTSRTLAVYAAAAEATTRRPALRTELHHLPSGRVSVWRHDPASRDRHVRRAVDVARDCVAVERSLAEGGSPEQLFPTRPSVLCRWCDYRESCPEGIEMGPAVAPWEALEPAEPTEATPAWVSEAGG
jgi:RecB family exonuclease